MTFSAAEEEEHWRWAARTQLPADNRKTFFKSLSEIFKSGNNFRTLSTMSQTNWYENNYLLLNTYFAYFYFFRIIYLFCFLFKYILCLIHPLLSTKSTIFNATLSTHVEKGLSPSYELIGGVSRVWVAVTNVVM